VHVRAFSWLAVHAALSRVPGASRTVLPGTSQGHDAAALAIVGVVLVGAGYVTVGYGRAFAIAICVGCKRAGLMLRLVLKRLIRRPRDFAWPPRTVAVEAGAGATRG
jgi:hypothetical protein